MENTSDYRALTRAALDGFLLLDGQGRFLDVNDAFCDMLGYSRAEMLSMRIADVEADQSPQVITRYLDALKLEGAKRFETRHRARDGRLVDMEVSAHYDADSDRMFVFLRDITARIAAQTTLRQRTHDLSERVKELRCLLDLGALLESRNESMAEILQQAVELLPSALQYPALAAAQLTLPDTCYATPNFRWTPRQALCEFEVNPGGGRGQLVVVYLEPLTTGETALFLPEEHTLLESIAYRLGEFIQRRRAEQSLHMRESSLNSLLELSQRASMMKERDIIQLALEEVERLTFSEIGYLHFVNPDQSSIQLFTWSRRTLNQCKAAHDAHYPLTDAGIWADCARLKRPVMHNDYQSYAEKKGYPVGHTHLVRHLSVPVIENESVKLILGVGNKPENYDDADVRQLLLTAEQLWRIVRRKRAENEARREAERVSTLAHVAALLNARLDLAEVLQTVCEETARALGFPLASVCFDDPLLHHTCHTILTPEDNLENIESLQAEAQELLLSQSAWQGDVFVCPPSLPRRQLGSLVAVRLTRAEQSLGTLLIYAPGLPRLWDAHDGDLLKGLANLASQAIVKARLFAEVSQSQEQLQTLSRRLVEVQESERRRIARELHDEVGQVLTAVKINLQTMRRQPILETYSTRLDQNIESVQRTLEQVRNLSLDLRPSILDDLGLSAALEWYAQRLTQMAELDLLLSLPPDAPRWSPAIEITCFRVAQEALTNILRHSQARHVWIDLSYSHLEMRMQVRDDGLGFEPAAARLRATRSGTSVGLLSMAERVALAGGRLEVESTPGRGTRILVIFSAATMGSN